MEIIYLVFSWKRAFNFFPWRMPFDIFLTFLCMLVLEEGPFQICFLRETPSKFFPPRGGPSKFSPGEGPLNFFFLQGRFDTLFKKALLT